MRQAYRDEAMTKPIVSALIDTYNQGRYVEQALVSVMEQGLSPSELEIVVVDDGSTDNTPAIIQKFLPRVRYIRKKNGGQASAFNAAIPETHAPMVAFLDADDWWAPGKLRAVLDTFERNPGIAAVGHGLFEVRGDEAPDEFVVPRQTCRIDLATEDAARLSDVGGYFLGTSRLAVRRAVLDRILPIPEELLFCGDAPILVLALALGGAILLDQPLCYYRLHSDNLWEFKTNDPVKLRRKYEILACYLQMIPRRLAEAGVPQEVIDVFLQREREDIGTLPASHRWRQPRCGLFAPRRRVFVRQYKNPTLGYVLFKRLVAAAALVLPARRFYQLHDWYGRRNLKRLRGMIGNAELAHPQTFVQRRKITPGPPSNAPEVVCVHRGAQSD